MENSVVQQNRSHTMPVQDMPQPSMTISEFGQHVQILGWLYIVGYGLFLMIGLFVFMLLSGIGVSSGDATAALVLSTVGTFVAAVLIVLAVPGVAAGIGLLRRRNWARILAVVVGILGLTNVPIGTLMGIYALVMLTKTEATEYFRMQPPAQTAAPLLNQAAAQNTENHNSSSGLPIG